MIPHRPSSAAPPAPKESLSDRIRRLRLEESASSRPRFNAAPPRPASQAPRWLDAALAPAQPQHRIRVTNETPRRGTAGPPPPPSWRSLAGQDPNVAVDGRNRQGSWLRPHELIEREKLAQPLPGQEKERDAVETLSSVAGGVIAADLARGSDSLLLEHVAYLPNHLRVRLLDVFADWRNPYPLTDEGARHLLRTDVSDGFEVAVIHDAPSAVDEDDEADDWEASVGPHEASSMRDLDSLDLSFSVVSLRALRNLLLRPADPSAIPPSDISSRSSSHTPIPPPPKLIPVFPHLRTLNLTATPRIAFTSTFFDLLSSLLSLRSLSLSGKSLEPPPSASPALFASSTTDDRLATPANFLPLLASATPTLRTLNLSYIDLPHVAFRSVDWETRWLDLRVLGIRSEWVNYDGEDVGPVKRTRIRQEVLGFILGGGSSEGSGTKRKRRWVDVIV
ncbi:hypothetical protein Rhopal_002323-T1 [Rhodotorula paludigena]|uniref:Proteophosphoglycan ppg4 n=1 Tax=Rhodotorula paludigena TaxID=86838 RepID=A0AAV5GGN6_9BASI|nr:hypothetical protein Rhopal_002323-T1 [Rhodotorula paludigena]